MYTVYSSIVLHINICIIYVYECMKHHETIAFAVTVLEIKPQVLSRCVTSGVGEFRRNAKVGFGPGREVDGNGGFMVVECEKHVQTYGG